jgi:hypothetical protein
MAEIDIDKMLANQEKHEAEKEKLEKMKKAAIVGGIAALAALVIVIIAVVMLGEKSTGYFPLENGDKYIYNRKNKSPEEWQLLKKTAMVGEYECYVMNKVDQGNYFSTQEYYNEGKNGIIMLAVSKDYGKKNEKKMRLLPDRIKKGLKFTAGTARNMTINAVVVGKEEMSTPVGDVPAYRVEYKAGDIINREVWYAKDVGIIKITDRVTGDELTLIKRVEK